MLRFLLVWLVLVAILVPFFPGDAQSIAPELTLRHATVVTHAAWSVDSAWLLTTSEDSTAKVWDATTGDLLLTLSHMSAVRGGLWRTDGTQMLTWTEGGEVLLWDITSGESLASSAHTANVRGAAWSADETLVLSWSDDATAHLWNPATNTLTRLQHNSPVLMAQWLDARIYTFEASGQAHIWDVEAASGSQADEIRVLNFDEATLGVVWGLNGDRLLSWSAAAAVFIWNTESRLVERTLDHRTFVEGARWNKDETRILSWSGDDTARIWDAASGRELMRFRHEDWVTSAGWNTAEDRLLSTSYNAAWLWDAMTGEMLVQFPHENLVTGAAWNHDDTRVVSWSWDGTARVWPVN